MLGKVGFLGRDGAISRLDIPHLPDSHICNGSL